MTLSRIFDNKPNAITIHALIGTTLGNLQLFSAVALTARKADVGLQPPLLDKVMQRAWIPTSLVDLRHLKAGLKPYTKRFEDVYRPIRHSIFAHRLISNADADATLFGGTSRDEVSEILDHLHDLIDAISNLYQNGHKPELGTRSYKDYNQHIREGVSAVLKRLPDG